MFLRSDFTVPGHFSSKMLFIFYVFAERFYSTRPLFSAQIYCSRGPSVMELNVVELVLPHSRISVVGE